MAKKSEGPGSCRIYFLSPGSSEDEALIFKRVIDETNEMKARVLGVQLKAMGNGVAKKSWFPFKDPLQQADLVIATVWDHWDATNGASSSFEKELKQAREANQEIWLYVKEVDDRRMAMPDKALEQVLAFRDRIEQEAELSYTRYLNQDQWQQILRDDLSEWINAHPRRENVAPTFHEKVDLQNILAPAPPDTAALLEEAWSYATSGRITRAEGCFARSMQETTLPVVIFENARFQVGLGALDKAELWYEELSKREDAQTFTAPLARAWDGLGHAREKKGDLQKAETCYLRALKLNEQQADHQAVADNFGCLGNIYWMNNELEKAENAYRAALALNDSMNRLEGVANDYGNLGNVFGVWGRLDEAKEMYLASLEINTRLNRRRSMVNQYNNLGIVYRVEGDLEKAVEAYRKALAIAEIDDFQSDLAEGYSNLGNIYQELGQYEDAEDYYCRTLALDKVAGRREGMATQYTHLAILYQLQEDLASAKDMFEKAQAIYEATGNFMAVEQIKAWIADL